MPKYRGMARVFTVALFWVLCGIICAERNVYSGFLGCKFSRSVCQTDEECVEDHLFGNCQKIGSNKDAYQYYLGENQLQLLESNIRELIDSGATWDSLYTQCVLGNLLLAFRLGREADPGFCRNQDSLESQLSEESKDVLQELLSDYYDNTDDDDPVQREPPREKEDYPRDGSDPERLPDEFVEVHKYLKSHKRQPAESDFLSTENDYLDYSDPPVEKDTFDYDELFRGFTPAELEILRQYVATLLQSSAEIDPDYDEVEQTLPKDGEPDSIEPTTVTASREENNNEQPYQAMSPEDANTLNQLLEGKVKVTDLSDGQIARLTKIVETILKDVGTESTVDEEDKVIATPSLIEDVDEETDEVKDLPVKKEQVNYAVNTPDRGSQLHVQFTTNQQAGKVLEQNGVTAASTQDAIGNDLTNDPDNTVKPLRSPRQKYGLLNANYAYLKVEPKTNKQQDGVDVALALAQIIGVPDDTFSNINVTDGDIAFKVEPNPRGLNASEVASLALAHQEQLYNKTGFHVTETGIGHEDEEVQVVQGENGPKYFVLTFVLCGAIAGIVLAVIVVYIFRRHTRSKEKLAQLSSTGDGTEASKDYQDLCRQRMQSKSSEKPEPLHAVARVGSTGESSVRSPSSRSSTSSWSEEPVTTNMDISTGHVVLSYMEDHLKNKGRLDQEWEGLCAYEAEPNATTVAADSSNMRKNRYCDILPYDHSRVNLSTSTNVSGSDYSNASTITDHDPRNPAYIATQGPLPHTVADFWQMVWEQGSVVIVNLTRLTENGVAMCHRYWPEEGSDLYHIYEVHLVSEHIWCEDYLVRSFYLKNLQTNETRTVTQFHFLTWTDLGIPGSAKALLDFRRKVNRSYRGRSCPVVVHCSDGVGRTGTYCLVDMVLNRMTKGAKEIDIAATLEHIRDQRMQMVKTKEQFEFALAAVAEEVHAILKALPQ